MAADNSWFKSALSKVSSAMENRGGGGGGAGGSGGGGGGDGGGAGLKKEEKVDWRDTNVGLIGTDADKAARKAAADTEPMWANAGTTEGIQIWRVENKERKFGINHWPREHYGSFCEGDSYILLYTYKKDKKSPKLSWNIHFWLGRDTSQDEAGVAAYKTVELDDYLGTEPVQYRETMGWESQQFLSYFDDKGGMKIMSGGVDSGFVHVEKVQYTARLLEVARDKKYIRVSQVPLTTASMNHGEVYILDNGEKLYVWEGESSHAFEKRKASELIEAIRDERNGRAARADPDHEFWTLLGGRAEIASAASAVERVERIDKKLFRLDDGNNWVQIHQGENLDADLLKSEDITLVDTGIEIFLRLGSKVPPERKRTSIFYGQEYLSTFNRPVHLPISRVIEGGESDYFWMAFSTPDGVVEPFVPPENSTVIVPAPQASGSGAAAVEVIEAATLSVKIRSASGLVAGDRNGFSDPFVNVKLSGKRSKGQEGKTEVIKKTLDPEWNETVTLAGPFDTSRELVLEVWDKDTFSNDFLGNVVIPLKSLASHTFPKDFPLGGSGPGGLKISGSMRIDSISFHQ